MRSRPKSVRIPVALLDALTILRRPGGPFDEYGNDNAALVGLVLYAVTFPRRHTLTAAIAKMPPQDQNAIHDFLCRAAREGIDIAALLPKPATAEALLKLARKSE